MGISKNTNKNTKNSQKNYKQSNDVTTALNNLNVISKNSPVYNNSYDGQLNDIYSRIKNGEDFNYDPENDLAYRRYADEYNALSGLAIAGNQAQAQDLTGGYGSTYAPEVANQGEAQLKEGVASAIPNFALQAQNAYIANNEVLKNQFQAAADARNDELEQYGKQVAAYNNQYQLAQQRYADERNFDYNKYKDNRSFWTDQYNYEQQSNNFYSELKQKDRQNQREYNLKSYDVYNTLASTKCAEYNDKKNNKGMKSYLKGLVKAGKITKYMADTLYNKYKYVAPKVSGGSGGSRRGGGSRLGSSRYSRRLDSNKGSTTVDISNWTPAQNVTMAINLRNRGDSLETALNWVELYTKSGLIPKGESAKYREYYIQQFSK